MTTTTERSSLDRIISSVNRGLPDYFPGLDFVHGGEGALSGVVGYIAGLAEHDRSRAENLADELYKTLNRLSAQCAYQTITVHGREFSVPFAKVQIGRDGSRHGFTFCMYFVVPNSKLHERLTERHGDFTEYQYKQMVQEMGIIKEMNEYKYAPANDAYGFEICELFCYQRAYNGAIIFRGDSWSIHT
jgi:hypothetical protein